MHLRKFYISGRDLASWLSSGLPAPRQRRQDSITARVCLLQESRSARQSTSACQAPRLPGGSPSQPPARDSHSRDKGHHHRNLARADAAPTVKRSLTAVPEGRAPEAWQDENPVVGTDDQDILITVPDALSRSAETPLDGRKEGEDEKSAKNKAQKKKVQSGHCDKEETGEESESNGVYQWLDYFN